MQRSISLYTTSAFMECKIFALSQKILSLFQFRTLYSFNSFVPEAIKMFSQHRRRYIIAGAAITATQIN